MADVDLAALIEEGRRRRAETAPATLTPAGHGLGGCAIAAGPRGVGWCQAPATHRAATLLPNTPHRVMGVCARHVPELGPCWEVTPL